MNQLKSMWANVLVVIKHFYFYNGKIDFFLHISIFGSKLNLFLTFGPTIINEHDSIQEILELYYFRYSWPQHLLLGSVQVLYKHVRGEWGVWRKCLFCLCGWGGGGFGLEAKCLYCLCKESKFLFMWKWLLSLWNII